MKEVTRYIKKEVERELWARAGGRCQFQGCNRLLYRSAVTQESVNLAQKAHIYSFSEKGPRGFGPFAFNRTGINDICNLMLMCHPCHTTIDQDKNGQRYSADLLLTWKQDHEQRIEIVSGIEPNKKSNVVLYAANIGAENSPINYVECVTAMFPNRYPSSENPIKLTMKSDLRDHTDAYWQAEYNHLKSSFSRKIHPLIENDSDVHFSLFALAPQPLLILLGTEFTDKITVDTYQPHREPKGWQWQVEPNDFEFILHRPKKITGQPVLLLSLSDNVAHERIKQILGDDLSIWEVTIQAPHNDFLKSQQQLSQFRSIIRKLMVEIKEQVGSTTPLNIFPVMPVSCAVELGRSRMPKADMPWVIFDHNNKVNAFMKTIEISGD